MQHDELLTAIYTHIENTAGLPTCYYPNVENSQPTTTYLQAFVLPTAPDNIGLNGMAWFRGLIQIDVVVKDGEGEINAASIAQDVINAFPRGTTLAEGTTSVRIDNQAYASAGIQVGNGWYKIPVTIPYNKLC